MGQCGEIGGEQKYLVFVFLSSSPAIQPTPLRIVQRRQTVNTRGFGPREKRSCRLLAATANNSCGVPILWEAFDVDM